MEFSELFKEPCFLTTTATQDHKVDVLYKLILVMISFIACSEHFVVLYPSKKQQNKILYQLCQSSKLIS